MWQISNGIRSATGRDVGSAALLLASFSLRGLVGCCGARAFAAHLLTSIHPKDGDVKIERVTLKGWIPDLAAVGEQAVRMRGALPGFSD